ncbi:MAG: DUF3795 domain-containing protein [bacterium]|nr:DUF3795 domain-containing protein [bacterium]
MMVNRDLISPCGLYCGVCSIYYATKNNDQKLKEKLAKVYNETPDKINCSGCRSDSVYWYCNVCGIKSCALEKNYEGCYQCDDFPCEKVESFPVPDGKKHILRAVPQWKELGTEKWAAAEKELFTCKQCSSELFRGSRKCRECNTLTGQGSHKKSNNQK